MVKTEIVPRDDGGYFIRICSGVDKEQVIKIFPESHQVIIQFDNLSVCPGNVDYSFKASKLTIKTVKEEKQDLFVVENENQF